MRAWTSKKNIKDNSMRLQQPKGCSQLKQISWRRQIDSPYGSVTDTYRWPAATTFITSIAPGNYMKKKYWWTILLNAALYQEKETTCKGVPVAKWFFSLWLLLIVPKTKVKKAGQTQMCNVWFVDIFEFESLSTFVCSSTHKAINNIV